MLFFSSFAWGQTPIDNSYFSSNQPTYTWDIAGSPYEIMDDIEIPLGSNLIIEPDVEVLFQGHYYIDVKGSINAIGANLHRITITSIINTSSEQNIKISIYSISGQRVYFSERSQINGEELISLSDFKPGVYIITIKTETKLLNKSIIIQ